VGADEKAANVFEEADNIRLKLGLDDVTPVCVLAALVKPNVGFTSEELKSFPLREREILDLYVSDSSLNEAVGLNGGSVVNGNGAGAHPKGNTALLKYCVDKTSLAREGKIDPIIGRDKETRMMLEILG